MPNPPQLPAYIYGLHDIDRTAQDLLLSSGRPGWVLDTVDLRSQAGTDYSSIASSGLGIIVRLNHGYGTAGTIPPSDQYDVFARRCADYVRNSPGARIWIIGNEVNVLAERPQLADGSREVITPTRYAQCFIKCRAAIKNLPGHADDWVIPAPVGPYNNETTYPDNPSGDWVQYFIDLLSLLGSNLDGITVHAYTHDFRADQIDSEQLMEPPFDHRYFQFRAYRDFMNSIPENCRSLPVLITEANPASGWRDSNIAWIQAVYQEIQDWNADPSRQPIQALVLFRWQKLDDHPEWGIQDKPALIADFRGALESGYRVRPPGVKTKRAPAPPPDYRVQWKEVISIPGNAMAAHSALTGRAIVRNNGAKTWNAGGPNPVRLGYHWYNERGFETPVAPFSGNWSLSRDVAPGSSITISNVELRAPQWPGVYTLKWDLVQEGINWFAAYSSPTKDVSINVTALASPREEATEVSPTKGPAPVQSPVPAASAPAAPANGQGSSSPSPTNAPVVIPAPLTSAGPLSAPLLAAPASSVPSGLLSATIPAAPAVVPMPSPADPPPTIPHDDNWAAEYISHDTPVSMVAGQTTSVNLRLKNVGESIWRMAGNIPVHIGYKWFNASGEQQLDVDDRRTALPNDVIPQQEETFGALLASPKTPGSYHLRWDLVAEGLTWFADAGSPPLVAPVLVTAVPRDVSDWRVESNLNPAEVAYSLDGDPNTYWDSRTPQAPGQWFRLNLSAPRVISGIQFLSPGRGVPAGYCLRASSDGQTWTEIARAASDNIYDVMAVFAPLSLQYAQVDLLAAPAEPSNWMIAEILVHPANPWTASASHNNASAGQAIDNDPETAWSSNLPQMPGMWFQIDLGRIEVVSGLALRAPADENPRSYRVVLWDAKESRWQLVAEKAKNIEPLDIAFPGVPTQFINIQLLEAYDQPWAIQEARITRELESWLGPGT